MPKVTVNRLVLLPAQHQRRPRGMGATTLNVDGGPLNKYPGVLPGSRPSNVAEPFVTYTDPATNKAVQAKFLFWSATDLSQGSVGTESPFQVTVMTADVEIVEWYLPQGMDGPPGPPFIWDDAFSIPLGNFVDDIFVDVTSDPLLTKGANDDGSTPTTAAETLRAYPKLPPHVASDHGKEELFTQWLLNGQSVAQLEFAILANTVGEVVAYYDAPPPPSPIPVKGEHWRLGSLVVGIAPGNAGIYLGYDGKFHRLGPWNPMEHVLTELALALKEVNARGGTFEPSQFRGMVTKRLAAAFASAATELERGA